MPVAYLNPASIRRAAIRPSFLLFPRLSTNGTALHPVGTHRRWSFPGFVKQKWRTYLVDFYQKSFMQCGAECQLETRQEDDSRIFNGSVRVGCQLHREIPPVECKSTVEHAPRKKLRCSRVHRLIKLLHKVALNSYLFNLLPDPAILSGDVFFQVQPFRISSLNYTPRAICAMLLLFRFLRT